MAYLRRKIEDQNTYEEGCADAASDIQEDRLQFFWGVRGSWGDYCQKLFRDRFGAEVVVTSCFAGEGLLAYQEGYNSTMKDHIDRRFGPGSVDRAWEEVQRWRKETYDAWVKRRESADS